MDDPWANTWGEPPVQDYLPTTSWTKPTILDEREADIAVPSWGTGTSIKWDEHAEAHSSLWSQPDDVPTNTWEPSPYEHIPIGHVPASDYSVKPHPSRSHPTSPIFEGTAPVLPGSPEKDTEPTTASPVDDGRLPSPRRETRSPVISVPNSPDAFGMFESAAESSEADVWAPSNVGFAAATTEDGAWGSSWTVSRTKGDVDEFVHARDEQEDEWAAAKRRKEEQDRQVPPELLDSIIRRFEELSSELWLELEPAHEDDYEWQKNIRGGMESIENLMSLSNKLIPDGLTLPPSVSFSKTSASKNMAESLRMTRHTPLTQVSPMARYLASKGSTAWEASVKSRPEVMKDDDFPVGWRVVEKQKESPVSYDEGKGKKAGGGLLSFWGRKQSSGPSAEQDSVLPPTFTAKQAPRSDGVSQSSRSSVDVSTESPTPASSAIFTAPSSPASAPFASTVASTVSETIIFPSDTLHEPDPPPSAVSRFLNRFSRTKGSTAINSSKRNSLALSSNDLEFLSDIVPTVEEQREDNDFQLKGLSSMPNSLPMPTKLPPPLAPPPRPPSNTRTSSGLSSVNQTKPNATQDVVVAFFNSSGPLNPIPPISVLEPSGQSESLALFPDATAIKSNVSTTMSSSTTTSSALDLPLFSAPNHASVSSTLTDDFGSFFEGSGPTSHFRTSPPCPNSIGPSNSSSQMSPPISPLSPSTRVGSLMPSSFASSSSSIGRHKSSFVFPPPPSSRSQSPGNTSRPTSRTPPVIMSSTPPTQQPIQPSSSFRFPPPPSSLSHAPAIPPQRAVGLPTNLKPVPRLPTSSSHSPSLPGFDDSDFTEFQSPPSFSSGYDTSFSSSVSSNRSLFSPSTSRSESANNTFDDLDDFVSSLIRTPSPPRPPAKPTPLAIQRNVISPIAPPSNSPLAASRHRAMPSLSAKDAPPPGTAHQPSKRKSSRAAEHMRTQSLVESAAARQGQWPAPASPLPEVIPPPAANPFALDLFGDPQTAFGSTIQQQQAKEFMALSSSFSSPAVMAPPPKNPNGKSFPPPPHFALSASPPLRPPSRPDFKKSQQAPIQNIFASPPTSPTPPNTGKGGLSAQDLSFFEGL